jgi:hypothetical protein
MSEPVSLAACALIQHGRINAARPFIEWLLRCQAADGSVPIGLGQQGPEWPTSLAILSWHLWRTATDDHRIDQPIDRAVAWALRNSGTAIENPDKTLIGHNTSLRGWSWATRTHSWIEPTALFVLALKNVGLTDHARTREAVQMLVDRLLPAGGCNYGNTFVMGQQLVAHVQPTGMTLLALAGETAHDDRIPAALSYLHRKLNTTPSAASLSYSLLGLAAHERPVPNSELLLKAAWYRDRPTPRSLYTTALMSLAMIAEALPLTSYLFSNKDRMK